MNKEFQVTGNGKADCQLEIVIYLHKRINNLYGIRELSPIYTILLMK